MQILKLFSKSLFECEFYNETPFNSWEISIIQEISGFKLHGIDIILKVNFLEKNLVDNQVLWLSKQINNCSTQNNSQNPKRKFFKTFIFLDPVTRSKWVNFDPPLPNSISPTVSSTNFSKGSQPFLMLNSHKILSLFNFWNRHSERGFFNYQKYRAFTQVFAGIKRVQTFGTGKKPFMWIIYEAGSKDLKQKGRNVRSHCRKLFFLHCQNSVRTQNTKHKTQNRPSPHSSQSLQSSHFQTIGLVNTIKKIH